MAISESLLNKTVIVKRDTIEVVDSYGDVSTTLASIASIKMRINRNRGGEKEIRITGKIITSTHKGFCLPTANIRMGDYVIDGTEKYWVDFVDDKPGGVTDHHKEIYMTLTEVWYS